uniref:WRKY19-like zinc finger domain-containing protein n=1 Tax=Aegilops tauschii TaxID=37682 RepID=M8BGE2_AEGTA
MSNQMLKTSPPNSRSKPTKRAVTVAQKQTLLGREKNPPYWALAIRAPEECAPYNVRRRWYAVKSSSGHVSHMVLASPARLPISWVENRQSVQRVVKGRKRKRDSGWSNTKIRTPLYQTVVCQGSSTLWVTIFAEARSQPLMDSSAVLMSGSYTTVGHGQTSFSLDFRGSAMDNCSRGNRGVQRSGHASAQDDACRLVLGLGPSPEPSSVDYQQPAGGAGKSKAPVTLFGRSLSFTNPGTMTLGLHDRVGNAEAIAQHSEPPGGNIISFSGVDESSTSARRSSGGYIPSLLFASRPNLCVAQENRAEAHDDLLDDHTDNANDSAEHHLQFSPEPSATTMTDTSFGVSSDVVTGVTDRGQPVHRRFPKKCRFKGCSKGARGASGLCIAHGGGQRCQKPGCYKGAESRTAYCKAHGGGRRCMQLGCTKSAEGKTDHCIAHGGGRRCGYNSCPKAARGKSGRCIKHGGGKRAMNYEYSSGVSTVSECDGSPVPTPGRQELIPPQVLVPLSMKSSSPSADRRRESGELCVPEGRVHGGGLLSLLGGSFRNIIDVDKLSSR